MSLFQNKPTTTAAAALSLAGFLIGTEAKSQAQTAQWPAVTEGVVGQVVVKPLPGGNGAVNVTINYPTYLTQPGAPEAFVWSTPSLNGTNTVWRRLVTGFGPSKCSLEPRTDTISFNFSGEQSQYFYLGLTPPNLGTNKLSIEKTVADTTVVSYRTDGSAYRLESATDLKGKWTPVDGNVSGEGSYTIPGGTPGPRAFFRLAK